MDADVNAPARHELGGIRSKKSPHNSEPSISRLPIGVLDASAMTASLTQFGKEPMLRRRFRYSPALLAMSPARPDQSVSPFPCAMPARK
jgi:hypothetical protein